jgi:hypothetical protein
MMPTLNARVTDRQDALIRAVAEAEGLDVSELVRRSVFAFVWGNLEMVEIPTTQKPAVLRLHDFPRIARSLAAAERVDLDRLAGGFRVDRIDRICQDCGKRFLPRGLAVHRARMHAEQAAR